MSPEKSFAMKHAKNQTRAVLDAWDTLWRFRHRFMATAFAVTAVVLLIGLVLPRKYEATAWFERRTDMVIGEIMSSGVRNPSATQMNSGRQIVTPETVRRAVETVGQAKVARAMDVPETTAVAGLAQLLSPQLIVRHQRDNSESVRVSVALTCYEPEATAEIVNALVVHHIQHAQGMLNEELKHALQFFKSEADRARQRIDGIENKVLEFEIEHGNLLPDSPHSIQSKLADSMARLEDVAQQRDAAMVKVQALQESLDNTPQTMPSTVTARNPLRQQLEDKLREVRNELATCLTVNKMKPKHPDVVALKQQIESIRQEIDQTQEQVVTETQMRVNPKRSELELRLTEARSYLTSLRQQHEKLKRQVRSLNSEFASLFPVRSEYRKLTRAAEQAQRQLAFWEDNYRRVELAMTAEGEDRGQQMQFTVPASPVYRPVSPKLAQLLLAAGMLGLMAGGLSVVLASRSDTSFSRGHDVAKAFNLPLLGTVSELTSRQQLRLQRFRNVVIYPMQVAAMLLILATLVGLLYMDLSQPHVTEKFRSLSSLVFSPAESSAAPEQAKDQDQAQVWGPTAITAPGAAEVPTDSADSYGASRVHDPSSASDQASGE